MLSSHRQNEKQNQLNQILRAGLQLAFVPETWRLEEKKRVDQILHNSAKLTLPDITALSIEELLQKLKDQDFSLSNMEYFADLLLKVASVEANIRSNLAKKAIAIYNFAQIESKTYSFTIPQKIETAKDLI